MPPKQDKVKLREELVLAVHKFGRVPLRSNDVRRKDEDMLRQRIERAKKIGALTEEQYCSLISAAEGDDMAKSNSKMLCEQLALELHTLGRVPFRSNDAWRRDEDNLRQRIEHAKKTVPFFAKDWGIKIFDILVQEWEQLRRRRDLAVAFEDCYKRGSITEEQYRSLMSELESFLSK